jgi:hypothetical protein
MIDLIGNIDIILQTGMDWMSNVLVKKVDSWSSFVDLVPFNHNVVTLTPAGPKFARMFTKTVKSFDKICQNFVQKCVIVLQYVCDSYFSPHLPTMRTKIGKSAKTLS